jgi:hypothetical protein
MTYHSEFDQKSAKPPRSRRFTNIALLLITTLIVAVIGEGLFRYRFHTGGYRPHESVLRIQDQLVAQPDYGFSWRPNVRKNEGIVFDVADVEYEPLSTDLNGFINHPGTADNSTVDILGLGDSFVEHAAHIWFELAKKRRLNYYSMALHRTAPPQYARIIKKHIGAGKPTWIVIGLFENDFVETSDFQQWQKSDLDWFEYHSGTWCGPPVDESFSATLRDGLFQGWSAALKNVRANLRGGRMTITGPTEEEIDGVTEALREIRTHAKEIESRALIVLIPSKPTATGPLTNEAEAYDPVINALRMDGPLDILDLRPAFRAHTDPSSLFYEIDGHWNTTGMKFAGQLLFDHIRRAEADGP